MADTTIQKRGILICTMFVKFQVPFYFLANSLEIRTENFRSLLAYILNSLRFRRLRRMPQPSKGIFIENVPSNPKSPL